MDTRLPLSERLRVRLHLAMCGACRQFSRQMLILRRATHQLRHRAEKGDMPK
jgi:predicted anti-sigma-YlaC factor YlaD